ncbi:MAG: DNA repair protein RecN [Methylotenera sp.]|nr:DNA repair protein RecN [Oligoflexia bacterium]
MLETLKIKNIAIIDSAEITFKAGLNILSGETGAGKSIIIEAISLILGSRANIELIRSGCDEAVVEGLFSTKNISWINARLEKLGFESDTGELLIKRSVNRNGKHRIYINGSLGTLSALQELCQDLIDLCGQHEHQSLLKPVTQLDLVDRYGGLAEDSRAYSRIFSQFKSLKRERDELSTAEAERLRKSDFLQFQLNELAEANLQPQEDETLHAEKILLQSGESRVQTAEAARDMIEAEDSGAMNVLRAALMKLRALNQIDDRVTPIRESLERGIAEVEDCSLAIHRYLSSVDMDPERLQTVQERLSLIADLRRKYGATVQEMLESQERLQKEYSELGEAGVRLEEIVAELVATETKLMKNGRKLSASRKKVSDLLAKSVTGELKDLKMGDAKFMIELNPKGDLDSWTSHGADGIQFVVQTNKGEAARPLGKIASGGELSRMMLAIRRVIADKGGIGVYLFDEIDAGIGGQTAFEVGRKLRSVAKHNQVICITHLPQVASFAHHHLSVRKASKSDRTATEIVELSLKERKEELARMLGGPQLTKKSLENAAELLSLAR